VFPLPRMPGARKIRSTTTRAEDGRGWVLVHADRIPARAAQVESFYRKALADLGLHVTASSAPADPDRTYLRGRSRRAHAAITITNRPGHARTTVSVIWRVFR
jgi:hypothetical protein